MLIGFRKKLAKLSVLYKLKLGGNMLKKRRFRSWLRAQPKRHKSRLSRLRKKLILKLKSLQS